MIDDQAALREAMEWLEEAEDPGVQGGVDYRHRATLKRRLAMPVLEPEPSREILDVMRKEWWRDNGGSYDLVREIYRALYAYLAKPPTRTVWRAQWQKGDDVAWVAAGEHYTPGDAWNAAFLNSGGSSGRARIVIAPVEVAA